MPVLIYREAGVRIVLGTHDDGQLDKPDIQIERRPNGWAIFLHPIGGGDPSGIVFFLDDGRSFLTPDGLSSGRIAVLDHDEKVPVLDDPPSHEQSPDPNIITGPADSSFDESVARKMEVAASTEDLLASGVGVLRLNNVRAALALAESALVADSNDAEHEALLALVESLKGFEVKGS